MIDKLSHHFNKLNSFMFDNIINSMRQYKNLMNFHKASILLNFSIIYNLSMDKLCI